MNSSIWLGSDAFILKNHVIHHRGVVGQRAVDLDDLAIDRCQNVGRGLDGFDHDDLVVLADGRAFVGQFDKHHVAQLFSGVNGDANDDLVAFNPQPFVLFGKLHSFILR